MNASTIVKYLSAAAPYAMWFALVWAGKAPVAPFLTVLGGTVGGLGVFHAVKNIGGTSSGGTSQ